MPTWLPSGCRRTQCKLLIGRIKLMRNKRLVNVSTHSTYTRALHEAAHPPTVIVATSPVPASIHTPHTSTSTPPQLKMLRKETAELLRIFKKSNAYIKVEAVIHEFNTLEAYDIIEIYLELLQVGGQEWWWCV